MSPRLIGGPLDGLDIAYRDPQIAFEFVMGRHAIYEFDPQTGRYNHLRTEAGERGGSGTKDGTKPDEADDEDTKDIW